MTASDRSTIWADCRAPTVFRSWASTLARLPARVRNSATTSRPLHGRRARSSPRPGRARRTGPCGPSPLSPTGAAPRPAGLTPLRSPIGPPARTVAAIWAVRTVGDLEPQPPVVDQHLLARRHGAVDLRMGQTDPAGVAGRRVYVEAEAAPSDSSTGPEANSPMRIFGPCRSAMMPTGRWTSRSTARTARMRARWSSRPLWLKLIRNNRDARLEQGAHGLRVAARRAQRRDDLGVGA